MKSKLVAILSAVVLVFSGLSFSAPAQATTSCSTLQQRLVAHYLNIGDVGGAARYTHMCPATCPELASIAVAVASTDAAAAAQDAYATCLANASSNNNGGVCQKKNFALTPTPTISGTAKKGSIVVVKEGGWSPKPSKFTYQWLRDGKSISGATNNYYQIVKADIGHRLSVSVTSTLNCYYTSTKSAASTKAVVK